MPLQQQLPLTPSNISCQHSYFILSTSDELQSTKRQQILTMCDYTQVLYTCPHSRYTVRAWCPSYETTHLRCPPNVVAREYKFERCGLFQPLLQLPDFLTN